ncbi:MULTISPECIES: DUF4400 domain-containing protein [Pseudoalteromonas]|uniref:DUF4400 domain-containing protein n=1 Tax=Pseudoalteromonas TaxID=53246 RepID=UPI0012FED79D|nr:MULTISPECIES: DUF4400 domain-containing protein [Pseudoalteromonas]
MAKSEQHNQQDKAQRQGAFTKIVVFIISLPLTVLVTMIISILVEWSLLYYCDDGPDSNICQFTDFKPEMGADHSKIMLNQEAKYINTHFKESIVGSTPIKLAGSSIRWFESNIFKPLGIDGLKSQSPSARGDAWDYLISAYTIVKVVLLRLCVLLLSLPAYLLFAVVGIVTGLVERDLRKFGAGRESTDKYELSMKLIAPSIILCFVLYLSWPTSINPALIVVPFSALFGYSLHLTASNYKKYF